MRYDRLLKGLSLIGLLVLESTAWAGVSADLESSIQRRCEREGELRHICQGGPKNKAGKECTVTFSGDPLTGTCESSECPGQCVVVYAKQPPLPHQPLSNQPLFVPGTLTIVADDHFTAPGSSGDPNQPMVAMTILLRVTKEDGSLRFFTDTTLEPDHSAEADDLDNLENRLVFFNGVDISGPLDIEGLKEVFLYRQFKDYPRNENFNFSAEAKRDIAEDIRDMFHAPDTSIPVLAAVRDPIVRSVHTIDKKGADDPLGSGLSFDVEIGFACRPTDNKDCQAVAK